MLKDTRNRHLIGHHLLSALEVSQEDISEDSGERAVILYDHPVHLALYVFRTVGMFERRVHKQNAGSCELLAVVYISGLEELILNLCNLLIRHH